MKAAQSRRVLFVDDDPEAIDMYTDYFDRYGEFAPVSAHSAADALTLIEEVDLDCVVTDSVTTSDGDPLVSVAKRTRPTLPVLLHSGHAAAELPTEDADAYLPKGGSITGTSPLQALEEEIRTLLTEQTPESAQDGATEQAWQTLGIFDWTETPASTALLEALDEQTAVDPMDSPPLYQALDPDALDALLRFGVTADTDTRIQFEYAGLELAFSAKGTIRYRPVPRSSDGE